MTAKLRRFLAGCGVVATAAAMAGCGGEFVRDGKSPARLVIVSLQGASGAEPTDLGTVMFSDVITNRTTGAGCTTDNPCPTIYTDPGEVELRLQLRDIGNPASPTSPSELNSVTINRYHVRYVRADGRNQQGVDVPYEFDGAATFTVSNTGSTSAGIYLVRSQAKREAPLAALVNNDSLISALAYVTFYGMDQAGNEVSVTGTIEIMFSNFGDPA